MPEIFLLNPLSFPSMKPLFFLLALTFAFATACKKEEADALPKTTQTGQHTFGCLINGQAFLPKKAEEDIMQARPAEPFVTYYYKRTLNLSASGNGHRIHIALPGLVRPGTYPLGQLRHGCYTTAPETYYTDDSTHTGSVLLSRFDTVARIAAGTFEFSAHDHLSEKAVRLTKGRFDTKF